MLHGTKPTSLDHLGNCRGALRVPMQDAKWNAKRMGCADPTRFLLHTSAGMRMKTPPDFPCYYRQKSARHHIKTTKNSKNA
jgi:hypothetical protein